MGTPQRQPLPDDEPENESQQQLTPPEIDATYLVAVLNHWMRRKILRHVNVADVLFSASYLRDIFGISLSSLSYHVRGLATAKVIAEYAVRPVRGAEEHIYASQVTQSLIVHAVLKETEQQDIKAEFEYHKEREEKKAADGE